MTFDLASSGQVITLLIWGIVAVYLINYGGRNNGEFRIVISTGFRLVVIGATAAAIIGVAGEPSNQVFTNAAVQFILVLSAAVGGSYIAHANMSLRNLPNKGERHEVETLNKNQPQDKKNINRKR